MQTCLQGVQPIVALHGESVGKFGLFNDVVGVTLGVDSEQIGRRIGLYHILLRRFAHIFGIVGHILRMPQHGAIAQSIHPLIIGGDAIYPGAVVVEFRFFALNVDTGRGNGVG